MSIKHRKTMGFVGSSVYKKHEPHAMFYLSQNVSFWIATLSVMAFVAGNMVGQHGWYAFWKSVLGGYDDSVIVYDGTVPPLEYVPDFKKWAEYGGNHKVHTFSQIPKDALMRLAPYDSAHQRRKDIVHGAGNDKYVMGWLSPYTTGVELDGSHAGVDMRTAIGTPAQSIANGIVVKVGNQPQGAGKHVVVRYPHMPDPDDPTNKTTVLFGTYMHLSSIFVSEGDIVYKGQHIADTGNTGFSTGPHLEFQLTRVEGPYSPFTMAEARRAGLSYSEAINSGFKQYKALQDTVNPLVYVQANYPPISGEVIVRGDTSRLADSHASAPEEVQPERRVLTPTERRAARLASIQARIDARMRARLARSRFASRRRAEPVTLSSVVPPVVEDVIRRAVPFVTVVETVASVDNAVLSAERPASVHIAHDRHYSGRSWEKLTVTLYDSDGVLIKNPDLDRPLALQSANSKRVEFRPRTLSEVNFVNGEATVHALVFGTKGAVVFKIHGFDQLSEPMTYERVR